MAKKISERDPIRSNARKTTAARRIGEGQACACGESRPQALEKIVMCTACIRISRGMNTADKHHVAGKANSPVTIPIFVNDHRADLSEAQHDWPQETLENPDGSPLRAASACIRGFIDTNLYLIEKLLRWIADMLDILDTFLVTTLGPKWWEKTELNQFQPKDKSDETQ